MTSYSKADGPAEQSGRPRWQGRCGGGLRWRAWEIAAVVVGFMIYWPIGLALLGLKFAQRRGYRFDDAASSLRNAFGRYAGPRGADYQWRPFSPPTSGNAAFDEWRAAELAKLEEERRKLDAAHREFAEHLDNLRKARDREEFEGFMNTRNQTRPGN